MSDHGRTLQTLLQEGIVLACNAINEPTIAKVSEADRHAGELRTQLRSARRLQLTLSEARQMTRMLAHLYGLLGLIERRARTESLARQGFDPSAGART